MSTPTRQRVARPCSLAVIITATGERGTAFVQWSDGEYAVKLSTGAWVDVDPGQLTFVGKAAA